MDPSTGRIEPLYTRGLTLLRTQTEPSLGEEFFHMDEQGTRVRTSQDGGTPLPGMMDLGPWGEDPLVVLTSDQGASRGSRTGATTWNRG